ncbi:MAG: class I SAM-dependent methyltransferase [Methanomassiliicoccales archaeon]|nr:class I SAM-dependent methyltransferase [Methanomassiliicoccales archaeon]
MPNPKQKEYFDSLAKDWDKIVVHDLSKIKKIMDIFDLRPGMVVMDVGTGTGVLIPHLLALVGVNGKVVAVDYSEKMLEVAMNKFPPARYPNLEYVCADINDVPMSGEYDAIMCYSCFPHFIDQPKTVKHMSKGLKKGGRLMIAHSSSRDEINRIHLETGEVVMTDYLPAMKDLCFMLEDAGLEVVKAIDNEEMYVVLAVNSRNCSK